MAHLLRIRHRTEAKILIGKMAAGFDPIVEKQSNKISNITLKEVFNNNLQQVLP
jgi:hypothetical protein